MKHLCPCTPMQQRRSQSAHLQGADSEQGRKSVRACRVIRQAAVLWSTFLTPHALGELRFNRRLHPNHTSLRPTAPPAMCPTTPGTVSAPGFRPAFRKTSVQNQVWILKFLKLEMNLTNKDSNTVPDLMGNSKIVADCGMYSAFGYESLCILRCSARQIEATNVRD